MNKVSKKTHFSRKGFTLLEMVLVMAIMVIMSAYLYSTFKVVNYSHLEVTVVNDMHDYASLNLQAMANNLCNATSISAGVDTGKKYLTLDGDSSYILLNGSNILPGFTQYHNGSGVAKWEIVLTFKSNPAARTVTIIVGLKDRAVPSSGVVYSDSTVVYCPSCSADSLADLGSGGSASISFTTDPLPA